MNVPKFEFAMFVSKNESKNSSPEVSFFKKIKKIKNEKDECMVTPKQPVCPTEIIKISDDDDLPSTESYLMNETTRIIEPKLRAFKPKVIETRQEESSPERDAEANK